MATPQAAQEQSIDSLANLEERITRAVEIITSLRNEKAELQNGLKIAHEQIHAAQAAHAESESLAASIGAERDGLAEKAKHQGEEIEDLRGERKQVRSRIEKLLSQLDLLSAS